MPGFVVAGPENFWKSFLKSFENIFGAGKNFMKKILCEFAELFLMRVWGDLGKFSVRGKAGPGNILIRGVELGPNAYYAGLTCARSFWFWESGVEGVAKEWR